MGDLIGNKGHWVARDACPACGEAGQARKEKLRLREYRFGDAVIEVPEPGISVVRCPSCGLLFKDLLPSPHFQSEIFSEQAEKYWKGGHDFQDEARAIIRLVGTHSFDLLDIGAAGGGLLEALESVKGRLSALDVMVYPSLAPRIRGEFIRGLADSEDLSWSQKPYDVVTMFDVAEHLYEPKQVFANLQRLVKPGGFVMMETGNSQSYWPREVGPGSWWYAAFFEHHIFWSRPSLEKMATRHEFRLVSFTQKRHKEETPAAIRRHASWIAKAVLYRLTPGGYRSLASAAGTSGAGPWAPFIKNYERDHFRAVLQKTAAP